MSETAPQAPATRLRTPYPGLRPFEPDEWMIFFGREVMIAEVIERLAFQHLVFIHGASGSGKSSLVRAGILPKLARQQSAQGKPWATGMMRPSGGPLWNLATVFAELEGSGGDVDRIRDIVRLFNRRDASLAEIAGGLEALAGKNICILIDQFEELFRFEAEISREEAELFINLLIGLIPEAGESPDPAEAEIATAPRRNQPESNLPESNLYVIITMRSEFLGECARFDGFAEAINRAQYLVPRLSRTALMRSIRYPARNSGGVVTEALADRLINEVRGKPDELPLIQHGLMALWEEAARAQPGGKILLDREMIDARGGLAKCLSDHAEKILQEAAPDEARHRGAERIFRALTDVNAEGQAIRRPLPFGRLPELAGLPPETVRAIIDRFRAEDVCFLSPYLPAPITDDSIIDISHEALIRCWVTLSKWVRAEAVAAARYRELEARAKRWNGGRQGLLTDDDLRETLIWRKSEDATPVWAKLYGDAGRVEKFVAASTAYAEKERSEARIWKFLGIAGSAVLVVGAAIAFFLYQQSQIADVKKQAVLQAQQAAQQREIQDVADDTKAAIALKQGRSLEAQSNPDYKGAFNAFQSAAQYMPAPNAIAARIELGRLYACFDTNDLSDNGLCPAEKSQGLAPEDKEAIDQFSLAWNAAQTNWDPEQEAAWQTTSPAVASQLQTLRGEAALLAGFTFDYNEDDYHDAIPWYQKSEQLSWTNSSNDVGAATAFYYQALLEDEDLKDHRQNPAKTMTLLEEAAAKGSVAAEGQMGVMMDTPAGRLQSEQDYATVLQKSLVAQGNSIAAAYNLGYDCLYGKEGDCLAGATGAPDESAELGDQPDYGVAMFLFREAAAMLEQGAMVTNWDAKSGADAEVELGRMYQFGMGVPADGAAALAWYSQALAHDLIDQNYKAHTEYDIGSLLYDNADVKTDHAGAVKYLRQAIQDGTDYTPSAYLKIGLIYGLGGNNVPKNPGQAAAAFANAIKASLAIVTSNRKDDDEMGRLAWEYTLSGDFTDAKTWIVTARKINDTLPYQLDEADILMMQNDTAAARKLYLSHQNDKSTDDGDGVSWRDDVLNDFATLQGLGYHKPLMDEIEKDFGG